MSNWQTEITYIHRFLRSGILNTLLGFSVIFMLMYLGFSALSSNIAGYFVGLIFGFYLSKKFVFKSKDQSRTEGLRYLAAFVISFMANLLMLQFSLIYLQMNDIFSQLLATATYTTIMYLLSRLLVFNKGMQA